MLPETELIAKIRQLIAQAELESAIDTMNTYLEGKKGAFRELSNLALQIKSQFEKVQRDESLGIISQENLKLSYNQITNQVIRLLNQLESPEEVAAASRKKSWIWIGAGAVLVLAAAAWFIFFRGGEKGADTGFCPDFGSGSVFKVLVLPFDPVDPGKTATVTHSQIKRRLTDFNKRFDIKAVVENPANIENFNQFPQSSEEADTIAKGCMSDLVIWGTTEKQGSDTFITETRFKFIKGSGNFNFNQLVMNDDDEIGSISSSSSITTEGVVVDTITSFTSITTQGTLTRRIEDMLSALLLGVIAHETGDDQKAVEILSSAEVQDSSASLLWGMTLADSYWKMGQAEKAESSLNQVLDEHPNYWLALNNRAMINFKKGNYQEAVSDLTRQIENKPTNSEALLNRAGIFLKLNQVDRAEKDIERVKILSATPEAVDKNTTVQDTTKTVHRVSAKLLEKRELELNQKKAEQNTRKLNAEAALKREPRNVNALLEKAEASLNLGDTRKAAEASGQVLNFDPKNLKAIAIKLEAEVGTRKFDQTLQAVRQSGVTKEELLKARPSLREVLEARREN